MKIIVHNDDIGLTYGFTDAIVDSFKFGTTSSTSIRTNGTAYGYAISVLKSKELKRLGVGLHLNIVDGKTDTKELRNKNGNYKYSFLEYLVRIRMGDKKLLGAINADFESQFKKAISDGLSIDHVSGHNHTYMIPPIFEVACKLCKKFGVGAIRLSREPFHTTGTIKNDLNGIASNNLAKFFILNSFASQNYKTLKKYKLKTTDAFYGLMQTNNMSFLSVRGAIENARKNKFKAIEILAHPAYNNDKRDEDFTSNTIEKYVNSTNRKIETKTFQSERLRKLLHQQDLEIITYNDL